MMVTFISQCEKNALKRTRRVLDSFANRIGSNTWQTIITQEGLNAVQKLLRKTASKSTAVSCHWIRSRSRSDFLWVVGNRDEFDENGIVAVNYGATKRFIGEKEIMLDGIYANTNGQRLDQHLFAVGYVARALIKKTIPNDENLAEAVYIAGCWHDIGKIDNCFQTWVTKNLNKKYKDTPDDGEHVQSTKKDCSWKYNPRHNEFSLLLNEILFDTSLLSNDSLLDIIKHAIYWHHAKPLRKEEITSVRGIYSKIVEFEKNYSNTIDTLKGVFSSIDDISNEYEELDLKISKIKIPKVDDIDAMLRKKSLPLYKSYEPEESLIKYNIDINMNAKNALVRTAIVSADRLVSKLTSEKLDEHISNKTLDNLIDKSLEKERGLRGEIKECLDGFRKKYIDNQERNDKQKDIALKLAHKRIEIGILNGPAGCGKTKIALEWALETSAKQIYWICPRIQVCQGIFDDLASSEYLPNSSIEIVTGDIKKRRINGKEEQYDIFEYKLFDSDIVITTIDQIVNSITTHKDITTFMDFMNAHVVFDEYHEYVTMKGFNLLFAELIEAKKMQQTKKIIPNTLLVSATPNPYFVTEFLRLEKRDIISMESFNKSKYKINFVDYGELMVEQKDKSTFVISNIALTAQRSYIEHQKNENSILFHSKFTKKDKEYLFKEVVNSFEKDGTQTYDILRSGPALQASLNITCKKMISEMSNAENFLQRLGRLDRFGESSEVNHYNIAISEGVKRDDAKNGISKADDSSSWFLKSELFSLRSAKAWYDFLDKNLPNESYLITDIYKLYDEFYADSESLKLIEADLVEALKKSVELIESTVLDPVSYPNNKKEEKGGVKIKKNSLRGNSLFVQMAKCQIDNVNMFERLNEYAYENENIDEAMTYSSTRIDDELFSFMVSVHHEVTTDKKQRKSDYIRNARNPSTPIYLSYKPEDLINIGGVKPKENALYYAIGLNNKPIGIISEEQLKKGNENEK